MNKWLAGWTKKSYPDSKRDLCTCFIERGFNLLTEFGYSAMVTMESWMFLSSFETMRKNLLQRHNIATMVYMNHMVMRIAFNTCATVFANHHSDAPGLYTKVEYADLNENRVPFEFPVKKHGPKPKEGALEALTNPECGWFYQAGTSVFAGVPGNPIVYWASPATIKAFNHPSLGAITKTHLGMATCNNERFLRLWFEVSNELRADPSNFPYNQPYTWFPYNKGGLYRKWYGNDEYLVNWRNDGEELKREKAVTVDRSLNFRAMVSWSRVSSALIAVRFKPEGYLFDMTGPAAFGEKNRLLESMAFLNSSVGMHIARFLSATIDFQPGQIAKYPLSEQVSERAEIVQLTTQNIELSKQDWDAYETSWDFEHHPLI